MYTVVQNIVPYKEAKSAYNDEEHDNYIDKHIIIVSGKGAEFPGKAHYVKTCIAECGN